MMLMGALGGAILIAVPAFALGYWAKRWRYQRRIAPFVAAYAAMIQEIKRATPIFGIGELPAEQQEENEQL